MHEDLRFLIKVARNGAILAGLLFFSVYATNDFSFELCKTAGVFFAGYILTELAIKYKLKLPAEKRGSTKVMSTLLF